MAKEKAKSLISSFTSNGEVFASVLPNGVLKVWNTNDGKLLAEWKHSDEDSEIQFSCIACSLVGKKRKKENSTCLVALGTDNGEVFTINATDAKLKWKSSENHHGRILTISFANKGHKICAIGTDGVMCEMNSENGEKLKEIKIPKKYISSTVYISDDKILAAAKTNIRILSLEDGEELLKFSTDEGPVQHISMLEVKNVIITSIDKNLQIWKNETDTETVTSGPTLSMRHSSSSIECKNGSNEDDLSILSVSESGVAYIWILKNSSEENINPTKIKVEANKSENDTNNGKKKKKYISILAAKLKSMDDDGKVSVFIVYGEINSPRFTLVEVDESGEDIFVEENQENDEKDKKDTRGKKRTASDADTENEILNPSIDHGDPMDGMEVDNDIDGPTMGEKLASLNIKNKEDEKTEAFNAKPPSADSVHVLLKQALHADDKSLLLECLFRQDEKVIRNSVRLLNPSDVFKLLESLISMIQSRGIVVTCALPWLKSLLLQHSSSIMSQESSLTALNSLYQLIESRISTFNPTLQLSTSLDLLYTKSFEDEEEEEGEKPLEPFVFQDYSSDDEEQSEDDDKMETENENEEEEEDNEELEAVSNVSDLDEESDGMAE